MNDPLCLPDVRCLLHSLRGLTDGCMPAVVPLLDCQVKQLMRCRAFVHSMGYKNEAIQCLVRRESSASKGTVVYSLFLEAQSKFLMGACQSRSTFQAMGLNRAAHYTISLDQQARSATMQHKQRTTHLDKPNLSSGSAV